MTLEEVFNKVEGYGWLVAISQPWRNRWVVTYHIDGTTIMASHDDPNLNTAMIYAIGKMQMSVREFERGKAKKNISTGFITTPSSAPFKRRI